MKLYLFLNNFICQSPRAERAGSGVGAAKPPREPVLNLVRNLIMDLGPCGADVLPRARKAAQGLVLF